MLRSNDKHVTRTIFGVCLTLALGVAEAQDIPKAPAESPPPQPPLTIAATAERTPAISSQQTAQTEAVARDWLGRMNRALVTRNYEGTFFHLRGGKVETLRIVHRFEDGKVSERLVSLDGNGREIVRNDTEITCYLPDQRRVLAGQRDEREGALLGTLPPAITNGLSEHYSLSYEEAGSIIGRKTQLITVNPKDVYRFGYRLWLDVENGMPLKTQLSDAEGRVIEQVLFASLMLPDKIPKSAVQPTVQSDGFEWSRQQAPDQESDAARIKPWRVTKLPPGFKLAASRNQWIGGAKTPRAQLVYSDGLAFVSVFVEENPSDSNSLKGSSRVGSAYAYSMVVEGHQVTVVGEVPIVTVKLIAESTRPDAAAAAANADNK